MSLPCAFGKCPGLLHFTLLFKSIIFDKYYIPGPYHCVKNVQIWSFFQVRIFLYLVQKQENTDQKYLRI